MAGRFLTLQDPAGRRIDVELVEEDRDGSLTVRRDGRRMRLPTVAIERRDATHAHLARPLAEPLYEEVLVVEKRLLLKEELRLTKHREERTESHAVRLRTQRADVERDDPEV